MRILQVKKYNNRIAQVKYSEAPERWRQRGYGYPVKSMFYFMITDKQGYCIKERANGYIVFDNTSSRYYRNREEAFDAL